jgi:tetratricopeptide (TPR) repeat protein
MVTKMVDDLEGNSNLLKIREAEAAVEAAVWKAVQDEDYEKELETYEAVKTNLIALVGLSPIGEKERDRVLAYCLMLIDETLVKMKQEEGAVQRAKEALEIAERSEDVPQIARCSLQYGMRLLNSGQIAEAEEQFQNVYELTKSREDPEMQEILGWMLLVRGHILNGKSLYNQALYVLQEAESILKPINNYAGLAQVYNLMARTYRNLSNPTEAIHCEEKATAFTNKAKKEKQ